MKRKSATLQISHQQHASISNTFPPPPSSEPVTCRALRGSTEVQVHASTAMPEDSRLKVPKAPLHVQGEDFLNGADEISLSNTVFSANNLSLRSFHSCPAGQYSGPASGSCDTCVAGKYLTNSATSSEPVACTTCAAGTYSSSSSAVCTVCPGEEEFLNVSRIHHR